MLLRKPPETEPPFRRTKPGSAGFSLLEVCAAIAVLAIALTTIMGQWAGLHSVRMQVAAKQRAQALLSSIAERVASADWGQLGSDSLVWSRGRFFDPVGGDREPLTETAADARDNLVTQGLIPGPTGIRGLRIYIEYYRAETSGANTGVLLGDNDPASASPTSFRTNFALKATRDAARITGASPTTSVDSDAPVWIRFLAVWSDLERNAVGADANNDGLPDDGQYCQLFLARRS
jgi:type II secretory pathway pseudopilin PulG